MPGSVLFAIALGIVLLLVLVGVASPLFLIPVVIIGALLLLLVPWLAKMRGAAIAQPDGAPQGAPRAAEVGGPRAPPAGGRAGGRARDTRGIVGAGTRPVRAAPLTRGAQRR